MRIRLFHALENFINLPSVKSYYVCDLNEVIDGSEKAVRALRDLNCSFDQYDNWLVHCVISWLDIRSREADFQRTTLS